MIINEILHILLPRVPLLCNHKFCTTSNTSYISWPPLLILPFHVLRFTETFTTANKLPKGQLIVASVSLSIAPPHTKSFLKSVSIIKLKSFNFTIEHLTNNLIVLQQRLKIRHFCLLHPSTALDKLNISITNSHLLLIGRLKY